MLISDISCEIGIVWASRPNGGSTADTVIYNDT